MKIEDQEILDECIKVLKDTGHVVEEKRVFDVTYKTHPVASIFPDDRYVQFHEEFTQIGVDILAFKELMKWDNNHT